MSDAMARIKARVTAYLADEGTYLHDAIAPVASEIDMFTDGYLPAVMDSVMPDTALLTDLDRIAEAYGLARHPATLATGQVTFTGTEGTVIAAGTLVASESGHTFQTLAEAAIPAGGSVSVGISAVESGAAYNLPTGSITQLTLPLVGMDTVSNALATTGGADIESDELLRDRVLMRIRLPSASGCVADYVRWAREVPGVAAASCVPLWNGAGTVKVVIAGTGMTPTSPEIQTAVAAYIETVRPIGASVTVTSVTSLTVNIAATLVLRSGYTLLGVQSAVEAALAAAIAENEFEALTLPISRIGAALLDVPGIADYSGLTLNGSAANVALTSEQVPVMGTVTLT